MKLTHALMGAALFLASTLASAQTGQPLTTPPAPEMTPDEKAKQDEKTKLEMEALKEKVGYLMDKTKGMQEPGKEPPVTMFFKEGLKWKSADGNFEGALGGRFYFTYRHAFDRFDAGGGVGGGASPESDSFNVDTARVQLDVTFYKDYFARVEMEAGKGDDFFIKDGFIGWKGVPEAIIRFGQAKVPFSQEETCSSRFIDFAERSIVNYFAPAHDIGLHGNGDLWDTKFTWELSITNGQGKNKKDNNDEKMLGLRLRLMPLKDSDDPLTKYLRFGIAAAFSDGDGDSTKNLDTGDLGKLTVIDISGTEDAQNQRLGFEISWAWNSLGFRAEYVTWNREVSGGTDFDTDGFYIALTYLLTGEQKVHETRVKPKTPFSLADGDWGAFELAFRFALVDASDATDEGLIATTANDEVTQITIGVNWWLSQNFAFRLNFEHFEFDEDIAQGPDTIDDENIIFFRIQMDW